MVFAPAARGGTDKKSASETKNGDLQYHEEQQMKYNTESAVTVGRTLPAAGCR